MAEVQPYTIKDIAKALNLSKSTVSRAFNDAYEIKAETRERVLNYAEKINFTPNSIAVSLKKSRSRTIGVVICGTANNFFSRAVSGIESAAHDHDYHVIISQTGESYERELTNVRHLLSRQVDGLLVSLSHETVDLSHYKELQQQNFPVVFFDRVAMDMEAHKITVNNFQGAYDGTSLLLKSGFTRIAHLTTSDNQFVYRERLRGYKEALNDHHAIYYPQYLKRCTYGIRQPNEVELAVCELLSLPDKPDALFITNDKLAVNCLRALKKMGKRIPHDVGVAAFSNFDTADLLDPPLTVVRQPAFEMGKAAAEVLIQILERKKPFSEFISRQFETELVVTSSSLRPADLS